MTQLEALKTIAARNEGLLRPGDVVREARKAESPLHGAFEWDNRKAGEKYRLLQAQQLIRSFRVTVEVGEKTLEVPVFVGVSSDRTHGSALNPYRLTSVMMQEPALCKVAERDALAQLDALRTRYGYLKALGDVWMAIDAHKAEGGVA
jgi:hypothetical protein